MTWHLSLMTIFVYIYIVRTNSRITHPLIHGGTTPTSERLIRTPEIELREVPLQIKPEPRWYRSA